MPGLFRRLFRPFFVVKPIKNLLFFPILAWNWRNFGFKKVRESAKHVREAWFFPSDSAVFRPSTR